jgi:DNA modification methylase
LSQLSLFEQQSFEIFNRDANEIANVLPEESIDLCITSPPYWDILLQKRTADYKDIRNYGDKVGDLGLIRDYNKFIDALSNVFSGVYKVVKSGKYVIINVMDLRKKDQFFPFHMDIALMMRNIGFILDDIIIWDRRQEYNNLRSLGYPAVFRLNKTHEFLMIFKKPNTISSNDKDDELVNQVDDDFTIDNIL